MKLTVDQRTESMTLAALVCRSEGGRHQFKRWDAMLREGIRNGTIKLSDKYGSIEVERRCQTCAVTQIVELGLPRLDILSRKLRYPAEGYTVPAVFAGSGRVYAEDARAALLSRLFADHAATGEVRSAVEAVKAAA